MHAKNDGMKLLKVFPNWIIKFLWKQKTLSIQQVTVVLSIHSLESGPVCFSQCWHHMADGMNNAKDVRTQCLEPRLWWSQMMTRRSHCCHLRLIDSWLQISSGLLCTQKHFIITKSLLWPHIHLQGIWVMIQSLGLRMNIFSQTFDLRWKNSAHIILTLQRSVHGIGTAPVCDAGTTGSIVVRFRAVP